MTETAPEAEAMPRVNAAPRRAPSFDVKSAVAAMADIGLLPFVFLFAPVAAALARLRHKAPRSRAVLDRLNVALVRHHYYEPILYPSDLRHSLTEERPLPGLDLNGEGQLRLLEEFRYGPELAAIPRVVSARKRFGYRNDSFKAGDAELLYSMIRHFRPRRLYEIGSGHSTLMAREALSRNEEEGAPPCEHICIEPYEHDWLEEVAVKVVRSRVEDVDPALFEALDAGDILFIDSSHVIRPQGDVVHEYLDLLGRLKPGVLVHVHDIFTPRDYLESWVVKERRMWDEQYLLEAFLSFNREFEVICAANWLWRRHPERMAAACPVLAEEGGEPGSFWFRRVPGLSQALPRHSSSQ